MKIEYKMFLQSKEYGASSKQRIHYNVDLLNADAL